MQLISLYHVRLLSYLFIKVTNSAFNSYSLTMTKLFSSVMQFVEITEKHCGAQFGYKTPVDSQIWSYDHWWLCILSGDNSYMLPAAACVVLIARWWTTLSAAAWSKRWCKQGSFPQSETILILLLLKRMESLDVRHTLNCFNWEYLSVCGYTAAVEQACGKLLPWGCSLNQIALSHTRWSTSMDQVKVPMTYWNKLECTQMHNQAFQRMCLEHF